MSQPQPLTDDLDALGVDHRPGSNGKTHVAVGEDAVIRAGVDEVAAKHSLVVIADPHGSGVMLVGQGLAATYEES